MASEPGHVRWTDIKKGRMRDVEEPSEGSAFDILEAAEEGVPWEIAATALKKAPPFSLKISSEEWTQQGKWVVYGPARLVVDGQEWESEPCFWFKDFKDRLAPWRPSVVGENREDWVVGPSRGKE